jgi:hypothetical protein
VFLFQLFLVLLLVAGAFPNTCFWGSGQCLLLLACPTVLPFPAWHFRHLVPALYMQSYSPVDNIRPAAYPSILVTAGLHDPRVGGWHLFVHACLRIHPFSALL